MESNHLVTLATLRIIVGYLGEKEQFGWWSSSFFSQGSDAFLVPVFPRTQLLARCTGVSKAATILHDERIGIGDVYHLFRLPEEMAQGVHETLLSPKFSGNVAEFISSQEAALDYLLKDVDIPDGDEVGPIRIGDINSLAELNLWDAVKAYYAKGFTQGVPIFPYFSGGGR